MSKKVSNVTYVILEITNGDPESRFDITNNGMIKTKKIIDREVQEKYSLTIFAYNDAGFDSFELDVLVEDLNDNVPTFDKGMYNLGVQVRNMKMDFKTGGTWCRVGQETLMMKIYDFFLFS